MRWLQCSNPACPNHQQQPDAFFRIADPRTGNIAIYTQTGDYVHGTNERTVCEYIACRSCRCVGNWVDSPGPDRDAAQAYIRQAERQFQNFAGQAVAAWQRESDPLMDRLEADRAALARAADVPLGVAAAMLYLSLVQRITDGGLLDSSLSVIRDPLVDPEVHR